MFFQAEDGIRDVERSRGLGDVYKRQHYDTFEAFFENLPKGARLVGVELDEKACDLETFEHPRRCVYLLGAEDHGLSKKVMDKCHHLVKFKSVKSLNVAVAGTIIMYDRNLPKPRS